jgi:hypothetical protein
MSLLKLLIWSGVVLLLGGLAARSLLADELADKFEKKEFKNADGQTLLYRFLQPAKPKAGQRYPLVLFLHGAGQRGDDNTKPLVEPPNTPSTPMSATTVGMEPTKTVRCTTGCSLNSARSSGRMLIAESRWP